MKNPGICSRPHPPEQVWECRECGKWNKNRMNIMLHVEASHIAEEADRYTCHICGIVRHRGHPITHHHLLLGHLFNWALAI